MYRGILELKNDTSILRKIERWQIRRVAPLTAMFVKTKVYFCRLTLEINK